MSLEERKKREIIKKKFEIKFLSKYKNVVLSKKEKMKAEIISRRTLKGSSNPLDLPE